MIRILGVNIPENKRGEIGLTYIFGIGRKLSIKILEKAKISKHKIVSKWNNEESNKIRSIINEEYKIEGELKSEIKINMFETHINYNPHLVKLIKNIMKT